MHFPRNSFWRSKYCTGAKGVPGLDGISDKWVQEQGWARVWTNSFTLDSNLPAMSRARVWTNAFTMAEHIQQEAIAREGPLHSEELVHLLKTVIQGEAPQPRHAVCTEIARHS